jgi:hypothetical protein
MIPRFALYAVSLLASTFLMSACASSDKSVIEESTQTEATPMHSRPSYAPGSEGVSAGHW